MAVDNQLTGLPEAEREADDVAERRLLPLVYDELRGLARRRLTRFRPGQTLDTTALVHEAYLKLAEGDRVELEDRSHYLALASTAMRYIIVDHARHRGAQKRGGGLHRTTLDGSSLGIEGRVVEMLALDQALERLAVLDERLARVVEMLFFGGLTEREAASVLGVSERTVRRDWRKARAFLHRALVQPSAAG